MKKCKEGHYYCFQDSKCKPIPKGFRRGVGGYLRREREDEKEDSKKNGNGNGKSNGSSNGNGNGGNGSGNGNGSSGGNGGGNGSGGVGESVEIQNSDGETTAVVVDIIGPAHMRPRLNGNGVWKGTHIAEAGKSFAVDLGTYYQSKTFEISGYDSQWALGLNISNIGSKISYTESGDEDFLPMNLRLGSRVSMEIDDYNEIMFALDLNKLLVPTPPVYAIDSDGQPVDINGNPVQLGSPEHHILAGQNPNVGIVQGIFQSFSDAPGGLEEEINELIEAVENNSNKIHEAADVFYHLIMYLEANEVKIEDVMKELNKRKWNVRFLGTGQTGILLSGNGVPIDAVVSDFMAGEIEHHLDKFSDDTDLVIVEGQGALNNMFYSGVTLGLLHGCMPDFLVMTHEPYRDYDVSGCPIPSLGKFADLNNFESPYEFHSKMNAAANDDTFKENDEGEEDLPF